MNRNFKGIWIPRDIWFTKKLSLLEKIFLIEIDSLDNEYGCTASNKYFSEFFDLSKGRCSQIISSLEKKKLIKVELIYEGDHVKFRQITVLTKLNTVFTFETDPYLLLNYNNNISNNNTSNTKVYSKGTIPKEEEQISIPSKEIKTSIQEEYEELYDSEEHEMAQKWTLWLKAKFSIRSFDRSAVIAKADTIKKMKLAITENITLDQLEQATERAAKNEYHINNNFAKLKTPTWMMQQKSNGRGKLSKEFNVNNWLNKKENEEAAKTDTKLKDFKDRWNEVFGEYENNIESEWFLLSASEQLIAIVKIKEYHATAPPGETKYLKRPRNYLSSKTFLGRMIPYKGEPSKPTNTSPQTIDNDFMTFIESQTTDKEAIRIFQQIALTTNISVKNINRGIDHIIEDSFNKKIEGLKVGHAIIEDKRLRAEMEKGMSFADVVNLKWEEMMTAEEKEIYVNKPEVREKSIEMIIINIKKSKKKIWGNESLSIAWFDGVVNGKVDEGM